jgi:hypothetical protein
VLSSTRKKTDQTALDGSGVSSVVLRRPLPRVLVADVRRGALQSSIRDRNRGPSPFRARASGARVAL